MLGVQFLQSAALGQLRPIPNAPKRHPGLAQTIHIQRMHALRWRYPPHTAEVFLQKFDDLQITQFIDANLHGGLGHWQ